MPHSFVGSVHGLFVVCSPFTVCSCFVHGLFFYPMFHVKQFMVCSPFVHVLFAPDALPREQTRNKP